MRAAKWFASFVFIALATAAPSQACARVIAYRFDALDYPGATQTIPFGINDEGVVVGAYYDALAGFVYDGHTFSSLLVPGAQYNDLFSINNNGLMTGVGSFTGLGTKGFTYDGTNVILLDDIAGFAPQPFGLNDAGQIVGWYFEDDGLGGSTLRSFLISDGALTPFNVPNDNPTMAFDINNRGEIVGWYSHGGTYGFLKNGDWYMTVGYGETTLRGINDEGNMVGDWEFGDSASGLLFMDGLYSRFDFPGAIRTTPLGINNKNQIVGTYERADGLTHGFIAQAYWVATPEPETAALFGAALAVGWLGRRRKIVIRSH